MPILRDITFIPLTSPDPPADFIDHQEATTLEAGREEVFEAAAQATGIVNENRKKPVARSVGQGRNENRSDIGVGPGALGPGFLLGQRRTDDPAGGETQRRGFPV